MGGWGWLSSIYRYRDELLGILYNLYQVMDIEPIHKQLSALYRRNWFSISIDVLLLLLLIATLPVVLTGTDKNTLLRPGWKLHTCKQTR